MGYSTTAVRQALTLMMNVRFILSQPKKKKRMQLLHGDCLELMKHIPDKSVDMVLCDLPYGTTRNKWDKKIDLQLLFDEMKSIFKSHNRE